MAGELRITGGRLARRRIRVPAAADRGALRPTSDKVRMAIMASLGDALLDARVLDLFAGSGALGLEALSRGARAATFVERDRKTADAIADNARSLGLEPSTFTVVTKDAAAYVAGQGADRFDVVFADPPYALPLAAALLDRIGMLLRPGGVLVVERDKRSALALPASLGVVRDKTYGDTRVVTLGRVALEGGDTEPRAG